MSKNDLGKIEAILFVAGRPLSYKELAVAVGVDKEKVRVLLEKLSQRYKDSESGLALIVSGNKVQLFTSPEQAEVVAAYLNKEKQSDLTRPSLETLSIIAYRGPVAKTEIEKIRGVNCSLIIRNLLIRGLINEVEKSGEKFYEVTHDFLRFLGVNKSSDLPDYAKLSADEAVDKLLSALDKEESFD